MSLELYKKKLYNISIETKNSKDYSNLQNSECKLPYQLSPNLNPTCYFQGCGDIYKNHTGKLSLYQKVEILKDDVSFQLNVS